MVDTYQTGEPVPDGYLHIQLRSPLNSWIEYVDRAADLPDDIDADFNIRIQFAEMRAWTPKDFGIYVTYDNHNEIYPWTNIHNVTVQHNSEAYRDALDQFRLSHDHEWKPMVLSEDGKTSNYNYCFGCKASDRTIEEIEQRMVDKARGLK